MAHSHVADLILYTLKAYAAGAAGRLQARDPAGVASYGDHGEYDLRGDLEIRLRYLSEALAIGHSELFFDHMAWTKAASTARGVSVGSLDASLDCMADELRENLPSADTAIEYIDDARRRLADAPSEPPSELELPPGFARLAQEYLIAVLETRGDDAVDVVLTAFDNGADAADLHEFVLGPAQREIGRMWQLAELHVAEEHFASRVAERVIMALHERMDREPKHGLRILLATPPGELHDIPCRILSHHFEWRGWTSLLLGASMPAHDLLLGFGDFGADVLAISLCSGLHVRAVHAMVDLIRNQSDRPDIPVLVGGRPFDVVPDLWRSIGADAYAPTARSAPDIAQALVTRL